IPPTTAARWMITSGRASSSSARIASRLRRSYSALRGTTISSAPRARSSSTTNDPRNPAPPVTTNRLSFQKLISLPLFLLIRNNHVGHSLFSTRPTPQPHEQRQHRLYTICVQIAGDHPYEQRPHCQHEKACHAQRQQPAPPALRRQRVKPTVPQRQQGQRAGHDVVAGRDEAALVIIAIPGQAYRVQPEDRRAHDGGACERRQRQRAPLPERALAHGPH